ncbi:ropporin-1-like isoform 2-T2 [Discoglossus pictus]
MERRFTQSIRPVLRRYKCTPYYKKLLYIPAELPEILTQFTKCAINSQPDDLLHWTTMYFRALEGGSVPCSNTQVNISTSRWSVLTSEHLRSLHQTVAGRLTIQNKELLSMWTELNLPFNLFEKILWVGQMAEEIEWLKFFILACSSIALTIAKSLKIACEILSTDHGKEEPQIPFSTFQHLYIYLADVDGEVSNAHVHSMLSYLQQKTATSNGMIKISDFISDPKVILE